MKAANKSMLKALVAFIIERHTIYTKKVAGAPKPWTKDPILQKYKFCNVYRELDSTTMWIANNWRKPNEHDKDLWFAMLVARLINWPDTLHELGYPVPWNAKKFLKVMQRRTAADEKVYSNAYMLTTSGAKVGKIEYNEQRLSKIWAERKVLRPIPGEALTFWFEALTELPGIGSFLAAQVVADVKYAAPFMQAPDWHTFAASGPGSRRGLNRVLGREVRNGWNETDWYAHVLELRSVVNEMLPKNMEPLHVQDLQNCLCEFDKYRRVVEAGGTSAFRLTLYPGGAK